MWLIVTRARISLYYSYYYAQQPTLPPQWGEIQKCVHYLFEIERIIGSDVNVLACKIRGVRNPANGPEYVVIA